jgi:hypothetical protein
VRIILRFVGVLHRITHRTIIVAARCTEGIRRIAQ